MIIEQLELLITLERWSIVLAEIDTLPHAQRREPRIAWCEALAAVAVRDVDRAAEILEPGLVLPQLREGAEQLGRLWRDYRALVVGRAAAATEQLPYEYDFSMRADDQRAEDQRDDDQPSITTELS